MNKIFKFIFVIVIILFFKDSIFEVLRLTFSPNDFKVVMGVVTESKKSKENSIFERMKIIYRYESSLDSISVLNLYSSVKERDSLLVYVSSDTGKGFSKIDTNVLTLSFYIFCIFAVCYIFFPFIDKAVGRFRI